MFKTLHRSGKLQINEENISITDAEELKILGTDDHYKFLGKCDPPRDFGDKGEGTGTRAMTRHTKSVIMTRICA